MDGESRSWRVSVLEPWLMYVRAFPKTPLCPVSCILKLKQGQRSNVFFMYLARRTALLSPGSNRSQLKPAAATARDAAAIARNASAVSG